MLYIYLYIYKILFCFLTQFSASLKAKPPKWEDDDFDESGIIENKKGHPRMKAAGKLEAKEETYSTLVRFDIYLFPI